jgi:hypothetical protein
VTPATVGTEKAVGTENPLAHKFTSSTHPPRIAFSILKNI